MVTHRYARCRKGRFRPPGAVTPGHPPDGPMLCSQRFSGLFGSVFFFQFGILCSASWPQRSGPAPQARKDLED